jgi:hypothetical protein
MASLDTVSPEAAVRLYLMFLDDPSKLVDPTTVTRLADAVDSAKDPIDRLKAMAALERAQATDGSAYRDDFIKLAKQWADEEGVPPSAFRSMGVPPDVLAAAGLDGQRRTRGRSSTATTQARRPAVKAEQLDTGILTIDGPFTIRDIADRIGGSTVTIRASLDRLEAQGKVTSAGERPGKRGRAAKLWEVAAR